MLVAHQQLQSLESAQIAEILQARIEELRGGEEEAESGDEETALMQASAKVHHGDEGISTYGLDLQFLTDELSVLPKVRAQVRAELLRGLLSKRYGNHAGRCSMGARAEALEAAVVAYGDDTGELEGVENQEDKDWCQKWWLQLLKAIVAEETARGKPTAAKPDTATVIESQETVLSSSPVMPQVSELDAMVEDEVQLKRELQQQQEKFEQDKWDHELALYEEDLRNQQDHDNENWEIMKEMEAGRVAQGWDDWVVWDAMHGGPPSPKRQRLIMHLRVEADNVVQKKMTLWTRPNTPITLGLTWSLEDVPAGAASSSSSTTHVATLAERPSESSELAARVSQRAKGKSIEVGDLGDFLVSSEGTSVYEAWTAQGFSDQQIRDLYGDHVLESFIAHRLMLSQGG